MGNDFRSENEKATTTTSISRTDIPSLFVLFSRSAVLVHPEELFAVVEEHLPVRPQPHPAPVPLNLLPREFVQADVQGGAARAEDLRKYELITQMGEAPCVAV